MRLGDFPNIFLIFFLFMFFLYFFNISPVRYDVQYLFDNRVLNILSGHLKYLR